jgi:hypothetical protein
MVKATPPPTFKMPETDFLLEFEIVALDAPTQLGEVDQTAERCCSREAWRFRLMPDGHSDAMPKASTTSILSARSRPWATRSIAILPGAARGAIRHAARHAPAPAQNARTGFLPNLLAIRWCARRAWAGRAQAL